MSPTLKLSFEKPKDHCCGKAFLIALLTAAIIFVPFIIWDKGYFFFFGDFNVQQIPFYKLAHEAVRTGDIFWNWYTDLGANFIGSYSFYLLGSPFFWLTLPFPTEFVPHLMAPLLILKHACAAFTACLYLKRFVRDRNFAVLGSLLYAFSGFAIYNVFFNHFHEAIICFPLLLTALEELIVNNRRGVFALAVAANAFINYWFFIGEVVFVLLYFAVRSFSPEWRMSFKKFFLTGFEAVLGMLIAMILFLPSTMALLGNPRTGASELLQGWNLWLYWHQQLYPAIASSALFPPDLPSRPNLFPDRGAKWASLSAWLPLVSTCGVFAYLKSRRDWLRKLLLISFLCAFVPVLNSAFILFNNSYYARWYYMPLLLMALASARALETPSIPLRWGMACTGGVTLGLTLILSLTPREDGDSLAFGLTKYPERFAAVAAVALLGLAAFVLIWRAWYDRRILARGITVALCFVVVSYSITFIAMGKSHSDNTEFIRDVALQGRYELDLPGDEFARTDLYDSMDNLGMFWHLPNLQAFHSVIPASIMDFYPKVGVKRDVSSKPETKYYSLRSFLSTRWFFVKEDMEDQENLMPGWELKSNQLGYNVYENKYWIPMGYTFDYYITVQDFEKLDEEKRAAALLRTLVLKEEAALRHDDILEHMPVEYYDFLTEEDYFNDCEKRIATAGSSFEIDSRGFTSHINLQRENLVFYSVPYEKGWTALINGIPTEIEKVDIGFMAVRAPAGASTIRFLYTPPGLYAGIFLTLGGLLILVCYILLCRRMGFGNTRKASWEEQEVVQKQTPEGEPQTDNSSEDIYSGFDPEYFALPGIEYAPDAERSLSQEEEASSTEGTDSLEQPGKEPEIEGSEDLKTFPEQLPEEWFKESKEMEDKDDH